MVSGKRDNFMAKCVTNMTVVMSMKEKLMNHKKTDSAVISSKTERNMKVSSKMI